MSTREQGVHPGDGTYPCKRALQTIILERNSGRVERGLAKEDKKTAVEGKGNPTVPISNPVAEPNNKPPPIVPGWNFQKGVGSNREPFA